MARELDGNWLRGFDQRTDSHTVIMVSDVHSVCLKQRYKVLFDYNDGELIPNLMMFTSLLSFGGDWEDLHNCVVRIRTA